MEMVREKHQPFMETVMSNKADLRKLSQFQVQGQFCLYPDKAVAVGGVRSLIFIKPV
jgi:hypothetical protein